MAAPLEFANADDLVARYLAGVSLKQLAQQAGVSRDPLRRLLAHRGVALRGRSAAMRTRWVDVKARGQTGLLLARAWAAADARNDEVERRVLSLYRAGLTSQARISERVGLSKPQVGGILRGNGLLHDRTSQRRAVGNAGGFNAAMQCRIEPAFAAALIERGLPFVHQHAIGTRNVDFAFPASRVAVEIVRRHWNDAKSLRRERLEQIVGAHWRLWLVYDPLQRGIDVAACCEHLVACLDLAGRDPAAPGQYWMVDGQGQPVAEGRVQLHHFARIAEPLAQPR